MVPWSCIFTLELSINDPEVKKQVAANPLPTIWNDGFISRILKAANCNICDNFFLLTEEQG